MRPYVLLFLLTTAQAQTVPLLTALQNTQENITAYLPALKSQPIAQQLKNAANRGIHVAILAPKTAHYANDTYLLSVLLASAQTPPAPIEYHQKTLDASPFILIDRQQLYLGPGTQGLGPVITGTPIQTLQATQLTLRLLENTPAVPVQRLIKEKYGLKQ